MDHQRLIWVFWTAFMSLPMLIFLSSVFSCGLAQEIPAGFKPERYSQLWKRNPFTEVTPDSPHPSPSPFDKLFLTSWLKVGATEMIFVQNSETNEVEKITTEPNQHNLRVVEFHSNPNPRLVEAVLSDGKARGVVNFKFNAQAPANQTASVSQPAPNQATTAEARPSRFYPGLPRLANGEGSGSSGEGSRFYPRLPPKTQSPEGGAQQTSPAAKPRPKHGLPSQAVNGQGPETQPSL
jgi:hypothetical protein